MSTDERRKVFAVKVLADKWLGVEMPRALLRIALRIRKQMIQDGTWARS